MPPGHYSVIVDSYGAPYPNQFAQVDLGAGQEAFVEVLSKREKVGGPPGVDLPGTGAACTDVAAKAAPHANARIIARI